MRIDVTRAAKARRERIEVVVVRAEPQILELLGVAVPEDARPAMLAVACAKVEPVALAARIEAEAAIEPLGDFDIRNAENEPVERMDAQRIGTSMDGRLGIHDKGRSGSAITAHDSKITGAGGSNIRGRAPGDCAEALFRCERNQVDPGTQTVIVTGASGNLGRAVVDAFDVGGANLVLVGRHREALAGRFGQASERRLVVAADLVLQADARAVCDAAMTRFGRIDVLCNVAGGFRMGEPVHETSDATWQFLFDLNAKSVLNMARAVVPRMLQAKRGCIVNVAAHAALRAMANAGAYAASKSVVMRLTEAMSAELREHGINVNCVLPTIIDTPENRRAMPHADFARWVAPDDLARIIVFLASPAARAIHGAAIPVTGLG